MNHAHSRDDHPVTTGEGGVTKSCCSGHATTPATTEEIALKDPVCGMKVTAKSPHMAEFDGKPVYFCCAGCKAKFNADPLRYMGAAPVIGADDSAAVPAPAGTIYTCPMHPEVRQDHPGACPKCGMALEPEMPSLEEGESPELVDFRRRFWWTLPLTVAVPLLAMLGHRLQLRTWRRRAGSSSSCRFRSCCGLAGRSSSAACSRSSTAAPTCGP